MSMHNVKVTALRPSKNNQQAYQLKVNRAVYIDSKIPQERRASQLILTV